MSLSKFAIAGVLAAVLGLASAGQADAQIVAYGSGYPSGTYVYPTAYVYPSYGYSSYQWGYPNYGYRYRSGWGYPGYGWGGYPGYGYGSRAGWGYPGYGYGSRAGWGYPGYGYGYGYPRSGFSITFGRGW
jgi:hypothetical protein